MKKRFLSAMALLLGASVTWADSGTATSTTTPTGPVLPPAKPTAGTPVSMPAKPLTAQPIAPAVKPVTPAGQPAASTVTPPRPIALPGAKPLQAQTPPMATPVPVPPTPVPSTKAPATKAVIPAPAAAPCQPQQPVAPKVDLRDCHCGPDYTYWASAEYLLWWVKQGPLPVALVTTGTGPGATGAIGAPGTTVALGNTSFDYGTLSGARFEAGTWLNCRHTLGIDAAFFFLGQGSDSLAVASGPGGAPLLTRPFFNVVTSAQSALLVSAPGALAGGVAVNSQSQIWGLESNFVRNLYNGCQFRADLLFGFRNLNLEENLTINQASTAIGPATFFLGGTPVGGPGPQTLLISDRFGTVNHFYGGQLGARFWYLRGPWAFDVMTKVALGVNHEAVNILGTTAVTTGAGVPTAPGGLLALNNANFGPRINDTTDYFAVAPEVKLGIGYQISRSLRAMVAWDFLYLSGVARPGNHIDTAVNPTMVPSSPTFAASGPLTPASGPFAPNLNIRQTDFWAQGINLGLLFTY